MNSILRRIRWGRLIIALIITTVLIYGTICIIRDIKSLFKQNENNNVVEVIEEVQETKETVVETSSEVDDTNIEQTKETVEVIETEEKEVKLEIPASKKYRLTSYYPEEDSDCTGSGKCSWDFQVNDKGWYTYKGKLVIAAATKECLNSHYGACNKWNTPKSGRKYFKYYEELKIVIDGNTYDAIVLDSCGASMYLNEDRIDLFVSNSKSTIDRGYKGVNMVTVYADYS